MDEDFEYISHVNASSGAWTATAQDIETDGNWTPKLSADVQWVKATKISPTELKVTVNYNDSKSLRTTDLMIVAGELEKQIKISQTCSDN